MTMKIRHFASLVALILLAAAPPAFADGEADLPPGPFGSLTFEVPEAPAFSYQFTADDVLWLARMITGEAGGKYNLGNRALELAAMRGEVENPVGCATEFANTAVYFRDKHKRWPTEDEWRAFNNDFVQNKEKWDWIGDKEGLAQFKKNTIFLRTRKLN